MIKTITYTTFILASIVVVLLFLTSKNYTQLALAVILYPGVAFLALNLFQRRGKTHEITVSVNETAANEKVVTEEIPVVEATATKKTDIADIDKRAFLKLIGAAGLSFFIFSIFSKKAQIPFFGKMGTPDNVTLKDTKGVAVDPAERQPLDGFQISEIDDSIVAYYGFINKTGAWFIMREDTETSSFRYSKGDAGFPNSWKNRNRLKYDYFYNL